MSDRYADKLRGEIAKSEQYARDLQKSLGEEQVRVKALREALDIYENTELLGHAPTVKVRRRIRIRKKPKTKSRFGIIMEKIGEAGSRGMTTSEIYKAAEQAGFPVKQNTIRSQIWHAKKDGDIEYHDGRYRVPQKAETNGGNGHDKEDAPTGSSCGASGSSSPSLVLN